MITKIMILMQFYYEPTHVPFKWENLVGDVKKGRMFLILFCGK